MDYFFFSQAWPNGHYAFFSRQVCNRQNLSFFPYHVLPLSHTRFEWTPNVTFLFCRKPIMVSHQLIQSLYNTSVYYRRMVERCRVGWTYLSKPTSQENSVIYVPTHILPAGVYPCSVNMYSCTRLYISVFLRVESMSMLLLEEAVVFTSCAASLCHCHLCRLCA